MRFKLLGTKKQMSFKIRNNKLKKKFKFLLGDSAIIILKNSNLDYVYFFIFKKLIKKLYKIKNYKNLKKRIWIYLMMNIPITKKSKNSRMGKGKGLLMRWTCRVSSNCKLFEFYKINFNILNNYTKLWSKKINLPLTLISKKNY